MQKLGDILVTNGPGETMIHACPTGKWINMDYGWNKGNAVSSPFWKSLQLGEAYCCTQSLCTPLMWGLPYQPPSRVSPAPNPSSQQHTAPSIEQLSGVREDFCSLLFFSLSSALDIRGGGSRCLKAKLHTPRCQVPGQRGNHTSFPSICPQILIHQAAIIKHHRPVGLDKTDFISLDSGGWQSEIMMPAWSGKGPLPGCRLPIVSSHDEKSKGAP